MLNLPSYSPNNKGVFKSSFKNNFSNNKNKFAKESPSKDAAIPQFVASFTTRRKEIVAAQKLRYRIFTSEYGAKIRSLRGIDKDRFDKHCQHLIVKDTVSGEIVGYTRVLTDRASKACGGYYSESEFDMGTIKRMEGRTIEIGRTCIDERFRNGAVIGVLWSAIGQYLLKHDVRFLIGCASISMADGGVAAHNIMDKIRRKYLTDESVRVRPLQGLRFRPQGPTAEVKMPPLLKAYLSMGAKVAGEPFWDTDFNVADVFIVLDMENVSKRYRKHFLREGA